MALLSLQCLPRIGRVSRVYGGRKSRRKATLPPVKAAAVAALGLVPLSPALDDHGLGLILQSLLSEEPSNALSLPTWTIHVASVVEWVVAMILVWQYGNTKNNGAWKGLSWGMVPLLGGALCACTWHFFYNAESLEILVVMQGGLTLVGNITLWIAAYRIYQRSQDSPSSLDN